jgi:hypothetical protein
MIEASAILVVWESSLKNSRVANIILHHRRWREYCTCVCFKFGFQRERWEIGEEINSEDCHGQMPLRHNIYDSGCKRCPSRIFG